MAAPELPPSRGFLTLSGGLAGSASADGWPPYRIRNLTGSGAVAIGTARTTFTSYVSKFGENHDVDAAEDVWLGGGDYTFSANAATPVIVSTDTDDDIGGTGATYCVVEGLDASKNIQREVIGLDGTTPVNLANSYIRIHRMWVEAAGTSESNEGTITCSIGGTDVAEIDPLEGQTAQAAYTIPNDYTAGYLTRFYGGLIGNASTSATLALMAREENKAWRVIQVLGIEHDGSSDFSHEWVHAFPGWPAKSDFKVRVLEVAGVNTNVFAGFDLLLA